MRVEPLRMGLVPYKKDHTEILCPFHHVRTQQKLLTVNQKEGFSPEPNHAGDLILDWPASRTVRNEFLLFISYSTCGILLQQSE